MPPAVPESQIDEPADFQRIWRAVGFSDLFMPLDDLLIRGGDPRLALDRARGVNEYGCGPFPSPDVWCFASSTASPISETAYERAGLAREKLMRSSIAVGFEEALLVVDIEPEAVIARRLRDVRRRALARERETIPPVQVVHFDVVPAAGDKVAPTLVEFESEL